MPWVTRCGWPNTRYSAASLLPQACLDGLDRNTLLRSSFLYLLETVDRLRRVIDVENLVPLLLQGEPLPHHCLTYCGRFLCLVPCSPLVQSRTENGTALLAQRGVPVRCKTAFQILHVLESTSNLLNRNCCVNTVMTRKATPSNAPVQKVFGATRS